MSFTLLQVALPPPPLVSSHVQESVLITFVILGITAGVVILLKPLVQALARRIEGKAANAALLGEVDVLRQQVAELEPWRERVHELEERMEFTERLLSQRREQDLLPRGDA